MAQYGAAQSNYAAALGQYNQNYQNALAEGREADLASTTRQMQEAKAYSQKDHLAALEGAQKQAQVAAAAASNGEAGNVVTDLTASIANQIAEKRATLESNYKDTVSQIQMQKQNQVLEEQMRITGVSQPIDPGIGSTLVNVGSDAVKAAGTTSGQAGLSTIGLSAM
ncbi:hypothetical protein M2322_002693 [Rhodoblastus acidophilus]|nr:hypothetical protein [Rhodoblastus acidophilus]MCW2317139.1 hypothetical protein [Rhodoblastus acidophilus]